MGPTSVATAKEQQPQSVRALYGDVNDSTHNASHGSDSPTSAQREILFFFPTRKLELFQFLIVSVRLHEVPTKEAAQDFVSQNIVPVLTEGLANLCKQKPADPIVNCTALCISNFHSCGLLTGCYQTTQISHVFLNLFNSNHFVNV
jgi:hypothetical protein